MTFTKGDRITVDGIPATVRGEARTTGYLGIVYDHQAFGTHVYLDEATVLPYAKTVSELDNEKVQSIVADKYEGFKI
ncbi:MAG: hypothetical protein DRH08_05665 [Deltaproteobacteria bacterium]|nr:MAG: hypothetical protein DRH08_05665 [Deltaproteobacteria bacterium]